jgi:hypothetical protein
LPCVDAAIAPARIEGAELKSGVTATGRILAPVVMRYASIDPSIAVILALVRTSLIGDPFSNEPPPRGPTADSGFHPESLRLVEPMIPTPA